MTITPFDILLAENSENDLLLIREAFEETNLINILAIVRDGEEALVYLREDPPFSHVPLPGMVIFDINMPKKTELEVLSILKSDSRLRPLPVIMLTVSEREEDVVRSYELGACSYIRKPVTFTKFMSVVKEFQLYWTLVSRIPHSRGNLCAYC
jgi:CheY-like chemotaxis protein